MLKFLRYLFASIMFATAAVASAHAAQNMEPITLNDEQKAAIARVNDYINSFRRCAATSSRPATRASPSRAWSW